MLSSDALMRMLDARADMMRHVREWRSQLDEVTATEVAEVLHDIETALELMTSAVADCFEYRGRITQAHLMLRGDATTAAPMPEGMPGASELRMTSWHERISAGQAFEDDVIAALHAAGWATSLFGSRTLDPDFVRALRRVHCNLHHLPDIVAVRDHRLAYIDAKTTRDDTPNYAVERDAVHTLCRLDDWVTNAETWLVFNDAGVLSPHQARYYGRGHHASSNGNGSGTTYLLVPRQYAARFADVFGQHDG